MPTPRHPAWTCPPGQPAPVGHVHSSARGVNMRPRCPLAAAKIEHVLPGGPQPPSMSIAQRTSGHDAHMSPRRKDWASHGLPAPGRTCPSASARRAHDARVSSRRSQDWACPTGRRGTAEHFHRSAPGVSMSSRAAASAERVHSSARPASPVPKCPLAAAKNEHVPPGQMFTRNEFLALALTEC